MPSPGIYCAPLRLLALEVFERMNMDGVPCELLTGQEYKAIPGGHARRVVPFCIVHMTDCMRGHSVLHQSGASHTSCTVEMSLSLLDQPFDVAVIDEIQVKPG